MKKKHGCEKEWLRHGILKAISGIDPAVQWETETKNWRDVAFHGFFMWNGIFHDPHAQYIYLGSISSCHTDTSSHAKFWIQQLVSTCHCGRAVTSKLGTEFFNRLNHHVSQHYSLVRKYFIMEYSILNGKLEKFFSTLRFSFEVIMRKSPPHDSLRVIKLKY